MSPAGETMIPGQADKKKMTGFRKWAVVILTLGFICLVIFFGIHRIRERLKPLPPAPDIPIPVKTIKAEPGHFTITRHYTGSIVSNRRALISALINSRVKLIHHREGETVKKGDLLISLDDRELRAETGRLESVLKRARIDLEFWQVQAARDEKLLRARVISPQKRDESRRMVQSLKASLNADEYALRSALIRLGYTRIRAPFSGIIQRLATETGNLATPGKVLVELVSTQSLKAEFSVPQNDLAEFFMQTHIHLSDTAEPLPIRNLRANLTIPAVNRTISAYIDHIYPALDTATRNATFDVMINEKAADSIRPGMSVDAAVVLAESEHAIVIPRAAIRTGKAGKGIYLLENDTARWHPVVIGKAFDKGMEITSGLNGGEIIIITPDPRLQDKCRVKSHNSLEEAP